MKQLRAFWPAIIFVALSIVAISKKNLLRNLTTYSSINWQILVENILLLIAIQIIAFTLFKIHPVFKQSLLTLVRKNEDEKVPFLAKIFNDYKLAVPLFVLLLLINAPSLVRIEELIFRQGTNSWWSDGIIRSATFGLLHSALGVPLGIGLASILTGLWLTYQYFGGGIELSILHHTTYNTLVLGMIITTSLMNKN